MTTQQANESVVDAYATKVLKTKSPPEACIDESLGPYVTSLLRCSLSPTTTGPANNIEDDVRDLPEFDSLIELLEEHCTLDSKGAFTVLHIIADAVRSGEVPVEQDQTADDPIGLLGNMLAQTEFHQTNQQQITQINAIHTSTTNENYPPLSSPSATPSQTLHSTQHTPLKPDRLIPVDLMGVLDDPQTPAKIHPTKSSSSSSTPIETPSSSDPFPPLGTKTPNHSNRSNKSSSAKPPIPKRAEHAKDLAAALFRPSRSRQPSIDETYTNNTDPSPTSTSTRDRSQSFDSVYLQKQFDSTVEILLSMNADLSDSAATEAAYLASGDINLAQFVVDSALHAPPICRHLLNDGCYRSDCHFSHDIEGHTCLFWLRGRCGKGHSCKFRHGFSEKLLEGIPSWGKNECKEEAYANSGNRSQPMPIPTKNLVSHNFQFGGPPTPSSDGFLYGSHSFGSSSPAGFTSKAFSFSSTGYNSSNMSMSPANSFTPTAAAAATWEPQVATLSSSVPTSSSPSGFSFANIASKGSGSGVESSVFVGKTTKAAAAGKTKTVKIPQDVWSPHINRNANVFQIPDPMKRYNEVKKSVTRNDVIDLHFQSTKTFSGVMSTVLPQKLSEHSEVWIVTGTGHHVGRSTHQKGGGALESALLQWLESEGYVHFRGRDRNGFGGCILVKR